MRRAALYVRVSTEEQKRHGLSVDSQIAALREYCEANGLTEVGLYNDAGISARKSYKKRPELLHLMQDCQEKKIDVILFTKLDRWFRSVADYYEVQGILDRCKVPWRAIWEDYETETSAGVFKVNIMLSIAQAEADRTSERIKAVFEYKRAQGRHVGSVPFGYVVKDGLVYKDESVKDYVQKFFQVYLDTHSTKKAHEYMRSVRPGTAFSTSRDMLKSSNYSGTVHGIPAEAYITKEQEEVIQSIRKKYTRSSDTNDTYLFQGLCVCGMCGYRMRSHRIINKYKGKETVFHDYVCNGIKSATGHKNGKTLVLAEKKIEKYLLGNLDQIFEEWTIEITKSEEFKKNTSAEEQKKKLEEKLKRVGIRFELGDITVEEYKAKRQEIQKEIDSIIVEKKKKPPVLPSDWRASYDLMDYEHKQQFWFNIIDYIVIDENKNIRAVPL